MTNLWAEPLLGRHQIRIRLTEPLAAPLVTQGRVKAARRQHKGQGQRLWRGIAWLGHRDLKEKLGRI